MFRSCGYVSIQRYIHQLSQWAALAKNDQEQVIGRTRDTDEELEDDTKPAIFDRILARMIGVRDETDGVHDHLLNFSSAVTGASFFVPSAGFLETL